MDRKFIQFELWKDCNIGCVFCFNKNQPDINKCERLQSIIDFLNSDKVYNYNEIGFIGGEFFSGQLKDEKVKKLWDIMIDRVCQLTNRGIFNQIDIMTSLIFNGAEFFKFMKYIDERKCSPKLFIGTSYDIKGRFQNGNSLKLWEANMKGLHNLYPYTRIHTQIVLTQAFIESVLGGLFDIKSFESKYHTFIDYNIPHAGYSYFTKEEFNKKCCSDFLLKRKDFLEFLKYVTTHDLVPLGRLFQENLKADVISIIMDGKIYDITHDNCDNMCLPLGLDRKAGYIDSDINILDDINKFKLYYLREI